MAIPRYSMRWLFIVTAIVAVAAFVVSRTGQVFAWSVGLAAVLVALAVLAVVHVALFAVLRLYSRLGQRTPAAPAMFLPLPLGEGQLAVSLPNGGEGSSTPVVATIIPSQEMK